jgi:RNA polymerase sigma-70 factor (ECF subfamily)
MSSDDFNADETLERFRNYLRRLAYSRLGVAYSAKLDPSDLVQETFMNAHQSLAEFRGTTDRERAAWLREIFVNSLADVYRALNRQKRDITRERSSERLTEWLELSAPQGRAEENEELIRLAWALSELPDRQHVAIELHHLQGLSLAETAKTLHCSEAAAAGLIRRGMEHLRELLGGPLA